MMRGLGRYVRVLRLFDAQHSQWTIADIAATLQVPGSTVYRTIQDMVAANFLEATSGARYRLGPIFIELDRRIRVTDPLYSAATPLLRDLAADAALPCVAFVARLYNDTVMCVSQPVVADDSVTTSYERGLPRPLTQGATSKAILAQLPMRRLRRMLQNDLGDEPFDALRVELASIRKRGFCVTRGEVDEGQMGIAAPVAFPDRATPGSVNIVLRGDAVDAGHEERLARLVVSAAQILTDTLSGR